MWKAYFIFSILLIPSLFTACTGQPAKSLEAYRMPTDVPVALELTAIVQAVTISRTPPKDCPVTVPPHPPFTPPGEYSRLGHEGYFWYGTNDLWVSLPKDGAWYALPYNKEGYTQKIPWWREGYVWTEEPEPDLIVTGERLDAEAPPLIASNAYTADMGSAMMMGVGFPTLGCWKITGRYKDAELSFVVWVAE